MNQKRKLGKRIASWLLCMVMVLSIVNLPGFTSTVFAKDYYSITVENGRAFDLETDETLIMAPAGTEVWIESDVVEEEQFKYWKVVSGGSIFRGNNQYYSVTPFTMPAEDVVIRAVYEEGAETSDYSITVENGTAISLETGETVTRASAGTKIWIERDSIPGKQFEYWEVVSGGPIFEQPEDEYIGGTYFYMPANDVVIRAVYEWDATANETINRVDINGYVTPSAGKLPVEPTIPTNDDYNVNRTWYEVSEVGNMTGARALSTGEKFECGKVYCLSLTISALNGKDFDTNLKVYVNGKDTAYVKVPPKLPVRYRAYLYTELNHDFSVKDVSKATLTANGKIVTKCKDCGEIKSTTTIYCPKTIKLSATAYTYDGNAKKPSVSVVDANGKTIAASNYTVTYASGRKNVGEYTVKVAFKGNYSGTKSLTFKINPVKTTIKTLTKGTKSFKVTWAKKSTQVTGYQIQYSLKSDFSSGNKTVTVKSYKTTAKTIKNLKAKKKYYVRVRTYKTVSGTNYYSGWSAKKYVTTK